MPETNFMMFDESKIERDKCGHIVGYTDDKIGIILTDKDIIGLLRKMWYETVQASRYMGFM